MTYTSRRKGEREALTELGRVLDRHDADLQRVNDEYAAKWNDAKRAQAEKNGDALPGGKFPIVDQDDMDHAATLVGNSTLPKAVVVAHMKKQAKKHGLTLPQSLQGSSSS
jgi:hypothetical protein